MHLLVKLRLASCFSVTVCLNETVFFLIHHSEIHVSVSVSEALSLFQIFVLFGCCAFFFVSFFVSFHLVWLCRTLSNNF